MLVPGSLVTLSDVIDAARLPLSLLQRQRSMAWRTDRWFADTAIAEQVAADRLHWETNGHRHRYWQQESVFSLPLAQDILMVGLAHTPEHTIYALDGVGVHHAESTDADVAFGLGLLERTGTCSGCHRVRRDTAVRSGHRGEGAGRRPDDPDG